MDRRDSGDATTNDITYWWRSEPPETDEPDSDTTWELDPDEFFEPRSGKKGKGKKGRTSKPYVHDRPAYRRAVGGVSDVPAFVQNWHKSRTRHQLKKRGRTYNTGASNLLLDLTAPRLLMPHWHRRSGN